MRGCDLGLISGFCFSPMDEVETSSVFEGSECGDLPEGEEAPPLVAHRVFRRREDILHEGAARGGPLMQQETRFVLYLMGCEMRI